MTSGRTPLPPPLLDLVGVLRTRQLMVCVGPAVRRAAGLVDDKGLAEFCRLALAEERTPPSLAASVEVGALIAREQYPEALERAEQHWSSTGFNRRVRPELDRANTPIPAVLAALVELSPALNYVATTNLDRLIERAFAGAWPELSDAPMSSLARRARVIVKLCGTVSRVDTWTLTPRQRRDPSPSGRARRAGIATLLRNNVVVFVGYAPDEQIFETLLDLREEAADEASAGLDVALVPAGQYAAADRRRFMARDILLVPVTEPYDVCAAELLRGLAAAYHEATGEPLPHDAGEIPRTAVHESPYPGLEPFTLVKSRYFCGREQDLHDILELMRADPPPRWLFLHGPSGVGKSSLLAAGVVRSFQESDPLGGTCLWRSAAMRPGYAPLAALASALRAALPALTAGDPAALERRLRRSSAALCDILDDNIRDGEGLVLAIDQLEEALSFGDPEHCEAFAAALAHAMQRVGRPFVVITAMRSDYIGELSRLAALHERRVSQDAAARPVDVPLRPLDRDQLAWAIERPARLAGLEIEAGLVVRMLKDAGPDGMTVGRDAETILPMVAAALADLFERRVGGTRLTHRAYDEMGGVESALTNRAEQVLAPQLAEYGEAPARAFFLRLATPGSERERFTRRPLPRDEALRVLGAAISEREPDPERRRQWAEAFLCALSGRDPQRIDGSSMRLLVVTDHHIELVHDVLLRRWARLRNWLDADRDRLLQAEALTQAARRWALHHKPRTGLPVGKEAEFLGGAEARGDLERAYQDALASNERSVFQQQVALRGLLAGLLTETLPQLAHIPQTRRVQREIHERLQQMLLALRFGDQDAWGVQQEMLALQLSGDLAFSHESIDVAHSEYVRAVRLGESAHAELSDPQLELALAAALTRLGHVQSRQGDLAEARGSLDRALGLLRQCAHFDPEQSQVRQTTATALGILGTVELSAGDLVVAGDLLQRALVAIDELFAERPHDHRLQRDRCALLGQLGQLALRRGDTRSALSLFDRASGHGATQAARGLAAVAARAGDLELARMHLRTALHRAEEVEHADPDSNATRRVLLIACSELGDLERRAGALSQARQYLVRACELAEALHTADPANAQAERDLSLCLDRLGTMAAEAGEVPTARRCHARAIELDERRAAREPTSIRIRRDLSVSLLKLGALELDAGAPALARPALERALGLRRTLASAAPADRQARRDLSAVLLKCGELAVAAADLPLARELLVQALREREILHGEAMNDRQARRDRAVVLGRFGDLERRRGDLVAAQELLSKADALWVELADPAYPLTLLDRSAGLIYLADLAGTRRDDEGMRAFAHRASVLLDDAQRRGNTVNLRRFRSLRTAVHDRLQGLPATRS